MRLKVTVHETQRWDWVRGWDEDGSIYQAWKSVPYVAGAAVPSTLLAPLSVYSNKHYPTRASLLLNTPYTLSIYYISLETVTLFMMQTQRNRP